MCQIVTFTSHEAMYHFTSHESMFHLQFYIHKLGFRVTQGQKPGVTQ